MSRRALWTMVGGLVLFAFVAAAATYFRLAGERIRQYTVDVAVQQDGSALVRETIDYDFGANSRHGIYRYFPGYSLDGSVSDVRVWSTAPDEFRLTDDPAEIRIGSEWATVDGLHRYVIEYRITGIGSGDDLGYDAIGTGWKVPIDSADITLTAPYALAEVGCFRGEEGSTATCDATVDGGTVTVRTDLEAGQGVTIDGRSAGALDGPVRATLPAEVDLDVSGPWARTLLLVLGLGTAGYLLGCAGASAWTRWLGRDRRAGPGADEPVTEPPSELTPAQGGVLLAETITADHRVAWLVQHAADGWLSIRESGALRRTDDGWESAPTLLRRMFDGRRTIRLGTYDAQFAVNYRRIDDELRDWQRTSRLWDLRAEKRTRRVSKVARLWGGVAAFAASVASFFAVAPYPSAGIALAGVAALLAGLAVGTAANHVELAVRTAAGAGLVRRVEGFRRYLAEAEADDIRAAAERDELRVFSAWAVALGEVDRWHAAVEAAGLPEDLPDVVEVPAWVRFRGVVLMSTAAPSQVSSGSPSGGGYSGGGSVGGGRGGGGGGSW